MKIEKLKGKVLKQYEDRAKIIKALAHPTRLFIMDMLKNTSLCVSEINEMIDADVSTISKHLSLLKNENVGLVSSVKNVLQVYYSLEMPCILESLSCIEKRDKIFYQYIWLYYQITKELMWYKYLHNPQI